MGFHFCRVRAALKNTCGSLLFAGFSFSLQASPLVTTQDIERNPFQAVQGVRDFFRTGDFHSDACVASLHDINRAFLSANPLSYLEGRSPQFESLPVRLAGVEKLTEELWVLRHEFRSRLRDFDDESLQVALQELRQFNRVLNFSRSYVLDVREQALSLSSSSAARSDREKRLVWIKDRESLANAPRFLSDEEIRLEDNLEEGDLMLFAGSSSLSALIRVLADNNTTDSHVGIVYQNEHGEKFIVHALVEPGEVIIEPISVLRKKYARVGSIRVYRHPNRELAQEAAKQAFDLVGSLYDFGAESENSQLNCVELTWEAYRKASDILNCRPAVLIPEIRSHYATHTDLRESIGMPEASLAPGDVDLHRELDLIAEVVNPQMLIRNMRYDAAADSVLDALNDGHRLRRSFLIREVIPRIRRSSPVRWAESNNSFVARQLDRAFPAHMPGEALEVMLTFDRAVNSLLEMRRPREHAYRFRHRGLGPTFPQMKEMDAEIIKTEPRMRRWLP